MLELDTDTLKLIGRAAARLAKQVEIALQEIDLTAPQYRVMLFLSQGEMAPSLLAAKLAISRPTVTAVIDGLVTRDLVQRCPDDNDRRRVTHTLTDAGKEKLKLGDECVALRLTRLAEFIPRDQREQAFQGLCLWHDAISKAVESHLLKKATQ